MREGACLRNEGKSEASLYLFDAIMGRLKWMMTLSRFRILIEVWRMYGASAVQRRRYHVNIPTRGV